MRILGLIVIEPASTADAHEQRRLAEVIERQKFDERMKREFEAARAENHRMQARLADTIANYEGMLLAANQRADSLVSPATIAILQEENRNLRELLAQANGRTDKLVDQHHEIAMKQPPTLMQQLGQVPQAGDISAMNPFGPGFDKAFAALRVAFQGQSRQSRDAIVARALELKAIGLKDEHLAKAITEGEGFRS